MFGRTADAAVAGLVAAIVVAAALVIAASQPTELRTFALRVGDSQPPVAFPGPHHPACEGPVVSDGPFRSVEVFGNYASGAPVLGVRVRSTDGRLLATGALPAIARRPRQRIVLDRELPGSQPVQICVVSAYGRFALLGGATSAPGVSTQGVRRGMHFALVLTRRSTLMASLGVGFSRAAIFRPDWVGSWTFWTLLVLLAVGAGLAIVAVTFATGDDEPPEAAREGAREGRDVSASVHDRSAS